ncbi:hypothetical protein EW145_g3337 [Phellinidium pouzarii]|uniref:Homeobox domain-containing protein n=1 Tax=Phellinidium pouzarii TaxID=167371 RepID=A0A4S4L7P2_9AGAM|nr:hypothetical protein EW145_g3337 [Phellinidium pouzarii]
MSPSRNEVFSPSFAPSYWPNSGHTTMAGHPPYPSYSPFELDPRYQAHQTSHSPYPMRQSPGIPPNQETLRRPPPINIAQPTRDDPWGGDHMSGSYPANFALSAAVPDTGNFHVPSSSYPMNYDPPYHSNAHPSSYPSFHPSAIDTRHHTHPPHSMHFSAEAHQSQHRASPNEWAQRTETHLVSPYARTPRESLNHSPQEPSPVDYPSVKKKRKRADAAQLKVLNEVYARTAFPTTEERMELAKKLDMSARSVQIWFQNKRQSTRQSRSSASALPPILHHPYTGSSTPSSSAGPASVPGVRHSSAEIAVSPTNHGGSYTTHSPGQSSHRPHREMSPPPPLPPPESMHRGRSPEGSGRLRRLGGHQY